MNTNLFFSNFSGAPGISRQNPGISRQKVWFPWVSKDIPNLLAPTPSRGRPLPHPRISGPKSLGLGSFFLPDFMCRSGLVKAHFRRLGSVCALDVQNRRSPIASVQRTRSTLAGHSAVPRGTNTTPSNCVPIARFESQRNERRVHEDQILCF